MDDDIGTNGDVDQNQEPYNEGEDGESGYDANGEGSIDGESEAGNGDAKSEDDGYGRRTNNGGDNGNRDLEDEDDYGDPQDDDVDLNEDEQDDDNGSRAQSSGNGSQYSRPGSAVVNLRGSRPNSAAVAQEIEGFDDDFMERVEEVDEEEQADEEEELQQDTGPSVDVLIERAQMEQAQILQANEVLQRRVRQAIDARNKGRPSVNRDMSKLDGAATRYRSSLRQWTDILEDRDKVESHFQTSIFDMKSVLEERIKRADDIGRAYKQFRLEVARGAEYSKTGRGISDKLLSRLEAEDLQKEEEVQRVRLKSIYLSNQLSRVETTLRQKEELAEGLHFIDFEQLKIENQSLNEKIEERNEDLLKLKKKTTTTVQILTHVREKLLFTEKENLELQSKLETIDKALGSQREMVSKTKTGRDRLRAKGRKIKENSSYVTDVKLLADFDVQKKKKEQLLHDIQSYTERMESLASKKMQSSSHGYLNSTGGRT
mmetsp:Transcript_11580/g.20867  ORF Transcript_11580/g.20867 Transcript_11580/m.20867 type:complete len:487 (-) Transcript_11580:445-1905(-)